MKYGLQYRGEFRTDPPAENTNMHILQKMPDVMASMSPSMSHPQNFRKHNEEVAISRVQKTAVRALKQMQRPETKTLDEHYTEGKPTFTEVSKLPRSILIIR
jgi:hypothetical protein